jgi:excinuclease ABC subunit C
VVERRYRRILEERASLPGLILIDGGKGHLNTVLQVLEDLGLEDISVAAIAKQFEQIFIKDESRPLILPEKSRGLHLLQEIRDEAHRFALRFHRGRRGKKISASLLDAVPGVGKKRKRILLTHFGSVEGIREASGEEITKVAGIGKKLALLIIKGLKSQE